MTTNRPTALTIAQQRTLAAMPEVPTTAVDVRDRMGLPRTRTAREQVEAALDSLAAAGEVTRVTLAGLTTYRRNA